MVIEVRESGPGGPSRLPAYRAEPARRTRQAVTHHGRTEAKGVSLRKFKIIIRKMEGRECSQVRSTTSHGAWKRNALDRLRAGDKSRLAARRSTFSS